MSPNRLALALALLLAPTGVVRAETVDATATTILAAQQDPRDGVVHTVVPVYEALSLVASDLRVPGLVETRIVVSAWGEASSGDTRDGENAVGDVDLAFAEGRLFGRRMVVRAGRQLVFSGVARNLQLDGVSTVARIGGGLGVEAYGGAPVAPRFTVSRGDAAAGGRLFFRPSARLDLGVSFVDVLDSGRTDRQQAGIDGRFVLHRTLTVVGFGFWSTVDERLAQASGQLVWQPRRDIELVGEVVRTAPDLFLSRTSIFSVFAESTRDEAGGSLYWRPLWRLRLWGSGYGIADESGAGGRGGVRATLALDRRNATTLGAELHVLELPTTGYTLGRAFVTRRFSDAVFALLDLEAYALDHQMAGADSAFTISGTLGVAVTPAWQVALTGAGGQTPLYERRLEAMAKVVYTFGQHVREVRP